MIKIFSRSLVSLSQIQAYERDGAILIKKAFTKEWLTLCEEGIKKNMNSPSIYSEFLGDPYYFNDYCNWRKIKEFEEYVLNSPAAQIACELMNSKKSIFYHEHILVKAKNSIVKTPFHHDQPYYPVRGDTDGKGDVCSLWMPLKRVPKESTLLFVKGSHRWRKQFIPRKFATQLNYEVRSMSGFEDEKYDILPKDIFENIDQYEILSFEVEEGDVVAFNGLTLHGSRGNVSSEHDRSVISTRWVSEHSKFRLRPWELSPPITGGLKEGQGMECETFPLIYSRK